MLIAHPHSIILIQSPYRSVKTFTGHSNMWLVKLGAFFAFCALNAESQYFDSIAIKVYRRDQPVTLVRADNVNDEKEITDVLIENEVVPVLKTGSFQNLTLLKSILIQGSNLRILEPSPFVNLPSLRIINLNFNRITEVPEGVFANLTVAKISLRGNGIRTLSPYAFYNLTNLEHLDLNSNSIKIIPEDLFYLTQNLRSLDFGYNQLESHSDIRPYRFFPDVFANVNEDKNSMLDLSNNNFLEINNNMLLGVQFVGELLLSNNNIRRIGDGALKDLRWSMLVDLEGNNLKKLSDGVLKTLTNVRDINVQNNPWENDFVCKYNKWCSDFNIENTMDMSCLSANETSWWNNF
ncbi:unnamed protein product [Phyllotreta striolata]|uniref:Uncharacterized protein n=1 Tax=Phyllotreta striolata TaxID=444603 RepID=A0A9P0DKU3_PHYSR|nr:unnamed protein product [Phyllotreta striolata]